MFAGTSEAGSVVYTFTSTDSSTSSSTAAVVAPVARIDLTAAASSGATAPTAAYCFPLYAKSYGSSGSLVTAPTAATFTLASVVGSGTFYSNGSCTTAITSSTIAIDTSSTTIYYKDANREAITLQATFNGTAGTAYSKTLGNPYISAMQFANGGSSCATVSFYMVDANSSTMVESSTTAVTVAATRTSGTSAGHFYTNSGCATLVTESGNISNLSIAPGSTGTTYYFSAGGPSGAATYAYSLAWSCGSDSGTLSSSFYYSGN